jgi:hypothetical protein
MELKFRSKGKVYSIIILQLRYAQGLGKKSLLVPFKGKPVVYPYSLKRFLQKAKAFGFVDAQKSYVINHKAVDKLIHKHHHYAQLDTGEKIYITKKAYLQLNALITAWRRTITPPTHSKFPWVTPN